MSKLLRGSKLFSIGDGTATLGMFGRVWGWCCQHSDPEKGTTGIPHVGARDAVHSALPGAVK